MEASSRRATACRPFSSTSDGLRDDTLAADRQDEIVCVREIDPFPRDKTYSNVGSFPPPFPPSSPCLHFLTACALVLDLIVDSSLAGWLLLLPAGSAAATGWLAHAAVSWLAG